MSGQMDDQLKSSVRYLGSKLGETIKAQLGDEWLERIEQVRKAGKRSNQGEQDATELMASMFAQLSDSDLLVMARAFTQFLNLANIAEQEFNAHQQTDDSVEKLFEHLDER